MEEFYKMRNLPIKLTDNENMLISINKEIDYN
jgi:hypothetical protein